MEYNTITMDNLGKGLSITVAAEQVKQLMGHAAVADRIIRIGLSNVLKDAHASIARDGRTEKQWQDESRALAHKALDAMLKGEVRAAKIGVAKVATEVSIARKIMLAKVGKDTRKKLAAMEDHGVAALDKLIAANKALIEPLVAAELARLAEEAKTLGEVTFDLSALA